MANTVANLWRLLNLFLTYTSHPLYIGGKVERFIYRNSLVGYLYLACHDRILNDTANIRYTIALCLFAENMH